MTFKEIEKKTYNFKGENNFPYNKEKINKNIIKLLKFCLTGNIKLELTDNDFVDIINIYYEINHIYYDEFLKKLAEHSITPINMKKVLDKILE